VCIVYIILYKNKLKYKVEKIKIKGYNKQTEHQTFECDQYFFKLNTYDVVMKWKSGMIMKWEAHMCGLSTNVVITWAISSAEI